MQHLHHLSLAAALACAVSSSVPAAVIVDDKWTDGSRKEQNPPAESAWFTSNSTNLIASPGKLALWSGNSSRQFVTYFTPPGGAVLLAKPGDSITATVQFSPSGVADENNSRNLRFGLFDFSNGKRLTSDSTPGGKGVKGYAAFLNCGRTFGTPNALRINSRTNSSNTDLLGASAAYCTFESSGQPANHSIGFTNGGLYTFQLCVKRASENAMEIRTVLTGGGLSVTNTASDKGNPDSMCARFDGFAIRSFSAEVTAERFDLTEFKVEGPPSTAQASR